MDWNMLLTMIGSGGLVGLVNWLVSLKTSRRKARLDQDDVFREMAEKNNQFIAQLIYEKEEWQRSCNALSERFALLEGVLYKLVRCRHYDTCPARDKLQEYKASYRYQRGRQSGLEQKGFRYPRDNPVEPGPAHDPDGQPP